MASNLTGLETAALVTGVMSGLGGLGLGILNAVHTSRIHKPRLRATFSIMALVDRTHGPGGPIEHDAGIVQIANVGRVPVVGSIVGIATKGDDLDLFLVSPTPLDGGPWPREIAPGHAVALRFNVESLDRELQSKHPVCALVTSSVGDSFRGPRKAMVKLLKDFESYRERRELASDGATGQPGQ